MDLRGDWRIRKASEDAETVYISEKFGVRTLHIGSDTVQSAMRIAAPNDLELSYTRSMMGFLLFNERPKSVLMIGLGGGSVAKFIYHRMPSTTMRVIELSERVVTVARRYFDVPPDDERFEVILGDGAEFVGRPQVCADLLVVDGYDGESLVEALASDAFYRDCHDRLNKGGMLVVNLWGGDRQFHDTLKRIEDAFPAGTVVPACGKARQCDRFRLSQHAGQDGMAGAGTARPGFGVALRAGIYPFRRGLAKDEPA